MLLCKDSRKKYKHTNRNTREKDLQRNGKRRRLKRDYSFTQGITLVSRSLCCYWRMGKINTSSPDLQTEGGKDLKYRTVSRTSLTQRVTNLSRSSLYITKTHLETPPSSYTPTHSDDSKYRTNEKIQRYSNTFLSPGLKYTGTARLLRSFHVLSPQTTPKIKTAADSPPRKPCASCRLMPRAPSLSEWAFQEEEY